MTRGAEMSDSAHAVEVVSGCSETYCRNPSHVRTIALRLQGKRWSEIAAVLCVTVTTLTRWRADCVLIDETIRTESQDFLDATKHALVGLLPSAVEALAEEIKNPSGGQLRIMATRTLLDTLKTASATQTIDGNTEMLAKLKRAAQLPENVIDAELAERFGSRAGARPKR